MDDQADLIAKKPVHIFKRLKLDPKKTIKALGKAAITGVKHDYFGVATNIWDGLTDVDPTLKAQYAAWALIYNALTRSIALLVEDYRDLFDSECSETTLESVTQHLDDELRGIEIDLDLNFFNQPEKLEFFIYLEDPLCFWLRGLGLEKQEAQDFFNRLKDDFVDSLHKSWLQKPADYECIEKALKTPFVLKVKEQREWVQYKNWLKTETQKSIFNEPITLEHIYVPLRAFYYLDKPKNNIDEDEYSQKTTNTPTAQVVDLESELTAWVKEFDRNNAIKVISGGPGSGKSSASKMFAVTVARNMPDIPVLFIQINRLSGYDFNAITDFTSKLKHFSMGFNPLDSKVSKDRLLLILDGLDELSKRGDIAAAAADAFVEDVIKNVGVANDQSCRWQVIITGRDIAIQSTSRNFKHLDQTLYLLPFIVNQYHDKFNDEKIQFEDPKNLLRIDQRDLWWNKYGLAIGQQYEGIPNNFKTNSLLEITREPLLNLLVALAYKSDDFNLENITINNIYDTLFSEVYKRDWYGEGIHHGAKHLEEDQYRHVLEEIALVAWHSGDARTAKESQIDKRCESEGITKYLNIYVDSAKKDISQLLTAFYFSRSHKNILGEDTFEFTHKTFGEYLIAKRLIRELELLAKLKNDGVSEKALLKRWVEVTGQAPIDTFILEFFKGEFTQNSVEENKNSRDFVEKNKNWQDMISHLLSATSQHDLPMELFENLSFKEMLKQAGNALEMLFVTHHACSSVTKTISPVNLGNNVNFIKQTINRMNDTSLERFKSSLMTYLNLPNQNLSSQYLRGSNLSGANLEGANLEGANLEGANLEGANLEGANLERANLNGANLNRANLKGANLKGANLKGANLKGANLKEANVYGSNLANIKYNKETILPDLF